MPDPSPGMLRTAPPPVAPVDPLGEAVTPRPATVTDQYGRFEPVPNYRDHLIGALDRPAAGVGGPAKPLVPPGVTAAKPSQSAWMAAEPRSAPPLEYLLPGGSIDSPASGGGAKPVSAPGVAKQSSHRQGTRTMKPEQILIEKAAVPEFFAKVAAETGISPHDAASASRLRVLGDQVVAGVERYVEKLAAAYDARADNVIKAAAAAADLAAGIAPQPAAPTPSDPTKVAADVEAYEAALAILKQASTGTEPLTPEVPGQTPEDEEGKGDPTTKPV